jgi:hypothetical protein
MVEEWGVRVSGTVTRMDGARRVAVPHGNYTMRESSPETFTLTGDGLPTFELTLTELETYRQARELKILEGQWP